MAFVSLYLLDHCNPLWAEPAQSAREHYKESVCVFRNGENTTLTNCTHEHHPFQPYCHNTLCFYTQRRQEPCNVILPLTVILMKWPISDAPLSHSALHWNRPLSSDVMLRISVTTCRCLVLPETVSFTVVKYLLGSVSSDLSFSWHHTTCTRPHCSKL